MIAANAARDLIHLQRPAALWFASPEIWIYQGRVRASAFRGPHRGASLILTDPGTLQLVAANGQGSLAHFSFSDATGWQGPVLLPGKAGGPPALIRSRFGNPGNLEVIVPKPDVGLAHYWRDGDASQPWHEATPPSADGHWSGVAVIHSSYGNLELVGVRDGELRHHWQAGAGGNWSNAVRVTNELYYGRPALIQSSFGQVGNFEVAASRYNGGLAHSWRNNDAPNMPWSDPTVFGRDVDGRQQLFEDVSLLQSSFGRLEAVARMLDGGLRHFRDGGGAPWEGPIDLLVPRGKHDE